MKRLYNALLNSFDGLIIAFNKEKAFREDVFIFVIFFPMAILADIPGVQKALLIFSLFMILIAELANTAIEAVVDRISTEKHPLSKMAKDVGSAMVFLALVNATLVWSAIFLL